MKGIRPFERPIHLISQRYQELARAMGGEETGRLARVECLLHIDVEELQAWWQRKSLFGHWYTPGNGTYLCDKVIEWDFVSHVEVRDPQLTVYSRRVAKRDEDVGLRQCTFCGVGSAPGWQICVNRTTSGICYTPLTKAGANDMLRAVKHDDDFDMLRVVLVGDEPRRRNPQSGGREPLPKFFEPQGTQAREPGVQGGLRQPLCQVRVRRKVSSGLHRQYCSQRTRRAALRQEVEA